MFSKCMRKTVAGLCLLGLSLGAVSGIADISAAKSPALSAKKLTINAVGKTKKLSIKNTKSVKKTKWSVSGKVVKLTSKKKTGVTIKALKSGSAKITAKITLKNKKKKTLKCTVTVKASANTAADSTAAANASASPAASANPSASAGASATPSASAPSASASAVPAGESASVAPVGASATPEVTAEPDLSLAPVTAEPDTYQPKSDIPAKVDIADQESLYKAFTEAGIKYFGTCANYYGYGDKKDQLTKEDTLGFIKNHFNSFTLENEMKPDAVISNNWGSVNTLTIEEAKTNGYYIPEGYAENKVPQLNYGTIDATLEAAYENGLMMRAHTLMWHQQTPAGFFGENFKSNKKTTPEKMDKRLEFYVINVMRHVMDKEKEIAGETGKIVYAWDVVNEYVHRRNAPSQISWMDVYGDMGGKPTYVKKAFELAYSVLKEYNATDKVTLFYNDYNTYLNITKEVMLINYINEGEEAKICGGMGMQCHVDVDLPKLYPDPKENRTDVVYDDFSVYDDEVRSIAEAVDAFLSLGVEVQVTELDVSTNGDEKDSAKYKDDKQTDDDQAKYIYNFMRLMINRQKTRNVNLCPKGITGLTIWGLNDKVTWRDQRCKPLLFGEKITQPKSSYYAALDAAKAK